MNINYSPFLPYAPSFRQAQPPAGSFPQGVVGLQPLQKYMATKKFGENRDFLFTASGTDKRNSYVEGNPRALYGTFFPEQKCSTYAFCDQLTMLTHHSPVLLFKDIK